MPLKTFQFLCLTGLVFVLLVASPFRAISQDSLAHLGIRAGYGLEFTSSNAGPSGDLRFFEAGHRFHYGAFVEVPADPKAMFGLFLGLEHQYWPKSGSYVKDCTRDSFPTFLALDDSLPGRDHRLVSVLVEPSVRFRLKPQGLSIRAHLSFAYVLQSKVEDYSNTCNAPTFLNWRDFEGNDLSKMSKLNFGVGLTLVKAVKVSERSGFLIETGPRFMLSSLFRVRHPDNPELAFSLVPWGMQLNIGFFR